MRLKHSHIKRTTEKKQKVRRKNKLQQSKPFRIFVLSDKTRKRNHPHQSKSTIFTPKSPKITHEAKFVRY